MKDVPQSRERRRQTFTGGIGSVFKSPVKKRDDRKSRTRVQPVGYEPHREHLLSLLIGMETGEPVSSGPSTPACSESPEPTEEEGITPGGAGMTDSNQECFDDDGGSCDMGGFDEHEGPQEEEEETQEEDTQEETQARGRITAGEQLRVYNSWMECMPSLITPYLSYLARTMGKKIPECTNFMTTCQNDEKACPRKRSKFLGLYCDRFEEHEVIYCRCQNICLVLVTNGMFPCSPVSPRTAVDLNLLALYQSQWERSCEAVTAIASALQEHYHRRGFIPKNSKDDPVLQAFRKGLNSAMTWYGNLLDRVEDLLEGSLQTASNTIDRAAGTPRASAHTETDGITECHRHLLVRCPACFARSKFGLSLDKGGDFHVSVDGNFNHRHLKQAGDGPQPHLLRLYLSAEYVDEVGDHIDSVRKKKPKQRTPKVPDEAVDECEDGHIAGTGTNIKTSTKKYDDTGTMALVCRHDIPIFLANIDTPGEQQKYAVALIKKLFTMIPAHATVAIFYDVGCVLDRSLELYDILPGHVTSRLRLATSAMHAYAHQWACQLVYSPRFRTGLGLSDGEGTERLWSQLRKLIGISRVSGRKRRLRLIDKLAYAVGMEARNNLGDWIRRRIAKVDEERKETREVLKNCEIPREELQELWKEQREAQISIRSFRAARLTKELDTVLKLHSDLERLDESVNTLVAELSKGPRSEATQSVITNLTDLQAKKYDQVEAVYGSLNIDSDFPELQNLPYDFVRALLLLRDLKINIRKRAIANFFEYDKIDRAAGGKEAPLGTNMHQNIRKSITKRQPALVTAIRKFNNLTVDLEKLNKPEYNVPTPQKLPTTLNDLRSPDSNIWEDVWISHTTKKPPKWLESTKVRDGIRAMLRLDRCNEEMVRLGQEADNLCQWYGRELAIVETALLQAQDSPLFSLLAAHRERLLLHKSRWATPLASLTRFESKIAEAKNVPSQLGLSPIKRDLVWVHPVLNSRFDDPDAGVFIDGPGSEAADYSAADSVDIADVPDESEAALHAALSDEDSGDEEDPLSAVNLSWIAPSSIVRDRSLLKDLRAPHPPVAKSHQYRTLSVQSGTTQRRVDFDTTSIDIFASSSRPLNDVCLNSSAVLLQHILQPDCPTSAGCAVFSTHDLEHLDFPLDYIWRQTRRLQYWLKPIWIVPIHREEPVGHWVVCTVYLHHRFILLFDSLADPTPWAKDIPDVLQLMKKLILAAKAKGNDMDVDVESRWQAHPVTTDRLQSSSTSCGLWVLAQIAAVLRGAHLTSMSESGMVELRKSLYHHVLSLP